MFEIFCENNYLCKCHNFLDSVLNLDYVLNGSAAKSHFTGNLIDGMTDMTGNIISKF